MRSSLPHGYLLSREQSCPSNCVPVSESCTSLGERKGFPASAPCWFTGVTLWNLWQWGRVEGNWDWNPLAVITLAVRVPSIYLSLVFYVGHGMKTGFETLLWGVLSKVTQVDFFFFLRQVTFFIYFKKYIYLAVLHLSCGMWDLVSDQGLSPSPLHWEHRVLATGSPGKSQ